MLFSKVVLFTISLGAISVLATPHALYHHALHRRVAARVAPPPSNSSEVTVKRQNSPKCNHRPAPPSSSPSSANVPAVTAIVKSHSSPSPATTPTSTPTSTPHRQQPATTSTASPPPSTQAPSPGGGDNGSFSGDGTFFESLSISPSCFSPPFNQDFQFTL